MSKHGKKMQRMAEWDESFPVIDVDRDNPETGSWVCWYFRHDQLRIEIALAEEEDEVWLYVDGDPFVLGSELSWEDAEARYEAATRGRLLLAHMPAIRAHEAEGLGAVRAAATAQGVFGQKERRQRTIKATGRVIA
jgi:hypothetical protein